MNKESITFEITQSINKNVISYLQNNIRNNITDKTWLWEYTSDELSSFTTASKNGCIVGTQGFINIYLINNDETIKSLKSESTFVSNSQRGMGTFEKMYDFGLNQEKNINHKYCWGFTNLTNVWKKKLGFETDNNCIKESSIVLTPIKFINNKNSNHLKNIIALLYYTYKKSIYKLKSYKIKHINAKVLNSPLNENDIENLLKTDLKSNFRIHMSSSYINWRLTNNPNLNYTKVFFYNENQLIGYYILSHSLNNIMYLVDIFANTKSNKKSILKHAINTAENNNAFKFIFWGNYKNKSINEIHQLMNSLGASTNINHEMGFVIKNRNSSNKFNIKKWYINGLWTEGFNF